MQMCLLSQDGVAVAYPQVQITSAWSVVNIHFFFCCSHTTLILMKARSKCRLVYVWCVHVCRNERWDSLFVFRNWNSRKLSHVVSFVTKIRRVYSDVSTRSVGLDICSNFPACFLAPGSCFPTPKSEEKEFECKFSPGPTDRLLHDGTACLVGFVYSLCFVASLLCRKLFVL